ncbi:MAG: zinc ribbon domain-containing protein [Chloroflexi bacterium]|jgi:hypothetical protein|nr:zinc ribbon domain-containing protein [Chloroflexota bacterium]
MDQRIYHGQFKPVDLANILIAHFNRGNLRVQQVGNGNQISVQIATTAVPASGGQTALSVNFQKVEDGVLVQIGKQAWLGIAASLGQTAISAMRNPFSLLGRLDDLAQDVENLTLTNEVWSVIDAGARSIGTGHELSERLQRVVCEYCNTANPPGEPRCIACGAPLGDNQPVTCKRCGFVIQPTDKVCPNCQQPL